MTRSDQIQLTRGMILAAGFGTRMRPLTEYMPKPLVPVCNVPMIDNVIGNLKTAGICGIAINSHHLSDQLADYLATHPCGANVKLFHEEDILGTGGGIVNAREFLAETEYFLLHNSDILTDMNLAALLEQHYNSGAKVTMALTEGPENKVAVSGGMVYDILDRLGSAPEDAVMLTYTGVMVISREIFNYLPQEVCNCSIITALLELMRENPGSVGAYIQDDLYWLDMGTLPKYFQAHEDILLYGKVNLNRFKDQLVPATAGIHGVCSIGKNVKIGQGAEIKNCIVLDNVDLEPGIYHCDQIIHPEFIVHRDELELRRMDILAGEETKTICSLPGSGSARRFYRIGRPPESKILIISDEDDADFERFVEYGEYFGGEARIIPALYRVNKEEYAALVEDLGDDTLYNLVKVGMPCDKLEILYRNVIDALVEFQNSYGADAPAVRVFDFDYLCWETAYFTKNILVEYCGLSESECECLDIEFDALARLVESHGHILIHRDFQSQNIMVDRNGKIRFVDYQGMRLGSPGYDIMSLVNDPYVELPFELRKRLFDYYKDSAGFGATVTNAAGLQRIMQALGAYGYLSRVKGKKQYLDYIPFAFSILRELLMASPLPLPALTAQIDKADITSARN